MEIITLLEKKNKLVIQVKGSDHTLCNALRQELCNDSHVKNAGYNIRHPLVGIPRIVVETDTSTTPKKALLAAAERLKKTNDNFKKLVKGIK